MNCTAKQQTQPCWGVFAVINCSKNGYVVKHEDLYWIKTTAKKWSFISFLIKKTLFVRLIDS